MAKNYVQPGEHLTIQSDAAVSSGDLVVRGDLIGAALGDAATGEDLVVAVDGVWELPKDTLSPVTIGDILYTDAAASPLHSVPITDDKSAGLAVQSAGTAAETIQCLLGYADR